MTRTTEEMIEDKFRELVGLFERKKIECKYSTIIQEGISYRIECNIREVKQNGI